MARTLTVVAFASLLFVACASTKPVAQSAPDPDPETEATIVGAVDEAVTTGLEQGEQAARIGHRVGVVAGVVAAVFGGPERESLDDAIDRYRDTRDAIMVTSAVVGTTKGAIEGAQRGYALDVQFAELLKIEGIEATRPFPDQIDIRFASMPAAGTLSAVAAVFKGRDERTIDLETADDSALDLREALIAQGLPATSLQAHRVASEDGILMRVRPKLN